MIHILLIMILEYIHNRFHVFPEFVKLENLTQVRLL